VSRSDRLGSSPNQSHSFIQIEGCAFFSPWASTRLVLPIASALADPAWKGVEASTANGLGDSPGGAFFYGRCAAVCVEGASVLRQVPNFQAGAKRLASKGLGAWTGGCLEMRWARTSGFQMRTPQYHYRPETMANVVAALVKALLVTIDSGGHNSVPLKLDIRVVQMER
jgi:hypothetical protein